MTESAGLSGHRADLELLELVDRAADGAVLSGEGSRAVLATQSEDRAAATRVLRDPAGHVVDAARDHGPARGRRGVLLHLRQRVAASGRRLGR